MHEVALMEQAIEILRSSMHVNGIKQVTKVKMVVGKMTAPLPEALKFAFEVFSLQEEWLKGSDFEIENKEITAGCQNCNTIYEVSDYRFICPVCSGSDHRIESGRELYIDHYEGE